MKTAYIIITDNDNVDQICETLIDVTREMKDLRQMGCRCKLKMVDWDKADAWVDAFNG